jgi:hypothetical protein
MPFQCSVSRRTTFFPSLILLALSHFDQPEAQHIKRRTAQFLLKQKSDGWSFNYWDRKSAASRAQPYPDDLDDSFTALAALWHYQPTLIDGKALAAAAKLLIATERQEGGPYKTWLVDETVP